MRMLSIQLVGFPFKACDSCATAVAEHLVKSIEVYVMLDVCNNNNK